ncbi:MAG: type II CAAX endopeptidase family protein [Pseudomonadota bacterium]
MNQASRLLSDPPAYRPGGQWRPIPAVIAVVLMFAIAAAAAVLVGSLADSVATGRLDNGAATETPAAEALPVLVWLTTIQILLVVLVIVASGWYGSDRAATLALGPPAGGAASYGAALLSMVVIFGLYTLIVMSLNPETLKQDVRPFADMIRSDAWWLALIAVGIGAPVSEELIFRGFLFSALARSRVGVPGAAVLTTTAWTSLHAGYSAFGLIEVFAVGLFFSWLLWKTGSLRVPLFCHAAYNTTIILALRVIDLPG